MAENTALTMSLVFKDQFSKQFQGASKQWNEGINSFKSGMASAQQTGSAALDKLGRGFGLLTTPVALATVAMTAFAAAMKRGIDEAARFESAMVFVALNLDKTMQEIEGIGEGIEKLAPAMAMTAEELAAAMEAIADAGFKGNDAMKLLERSAMLAKTTHTDLRTVIDLVTKSMVALGIGADEASEYTNKLYKMSLAGIGDFTEMASVMEFMAGTFKLAGLSADELLATTAHLSTVFPRAREAVMSMRGAIESIRNPSKDAQELAKALGIEFSLAGLRAKGLSGFFADLMEKTKGSEAALDMLLKTQGGLKLSMALSGEQAQKYAGTLGMIRDQSDRLGKDHAKVMATFDQQWKALTENFTAAFHALGNLVLPAFTRLLEVINKVAAAIRSLSVDWGKMAAAFAKGGVAGVAIEALTGGLKKGKSGREVPADWWKGTKKEAPAKTAPPVAMEGKESVDDVVKKILAGESAGKKVVDKWGEAWKKYQEMMTKAWHDTIKTEEEELAKFYAEQEKMAQENVEIDAEIAQAGAEEATAATKKQLEDYQSLLNDQVSFSAKIYQEEADAKQKSLEDMAEDTRRYLEDIAEQWAAMKMETFYDFFGESAYYDERLAEMVTRFRESYDEIYNFTVEAAQAMKQAFSDFFFDLMTGEMKSWKDYVGSFLRSLGRMVADWVAEQIKLLLQMAIAWAVSKAASGSAGGGGVGAAHSGGMVKRLHWGGLASNEVPAILQSGEYVVNKQAARRNLGALEQMNRGGDPGGQQVTVINIQAVDTQSFFDACQRNPGAVLAPISASLKNSGSLRYEIMEATQ